jgi:pSer/pThr/pTyr-binding forkhead associated (FHA) protein
VLELLSGPRIGTTFSADQPTTVVIGRSGDCAFRITDDPRVSRHHCELEIHPPDVRLRDLGSRNGTLVNDQRYRSGNEPAAPDGAGQPAAVVLHHGDRITVGRTVIEVRVETR